MGYLTGQLLFKKNDKFKLAQIVTFYMMKVLWLLFAVTRIYNCTLGRFKRRNWIMKIEECESNVSSTLVFIRLTCSQIWNYIQSINPHFDFAVKYHFRETVLVSTGFSEWWLFQNKNIFCKSDNTLLIISEHAERLGGLECCIKTIDIVLHL